MAANNNVSDGIQRFTHDSFADHEFKFIFDIKYLSFKKAWTFREEFKTNCKRAPTSWMCEMFFQKVLEDGRAWGLFTLTRKDVEQYPVKVSISLYIKDATRKFLFYSPKIEREKVNPCEEIKRELADNLPFPEMRSNFNLKLSVEATIVVSLCHFKYSDVIISEASQEQNILEFHL